jgi:hypothetical protein
MTEEEVARNRRGDDTLYVSTDFVDVPQRLLQYVGEASLSDDTPKMFDLSPVPDEANCTVSVSSRVILDTDAVKVGATLRGIATFSSLKPVSNCKVRPLAPVCVFVHAPARTRSDASVLVARCRPACVCACVCARVCVRVCVCVHARMCVSPPPLLPRVPLLIDAVADASRRPSCSSSWARR